MTKQIKTKISHTQMKQKFIYNCESKNNNLINNDYTVKQLDRK